MLFNSFYRFKNNQYQDQHYNKPVRTFSICTTKSPKPPNKNDIIIVIIACSLFIIYKKII